MFKYIVKHLLKHWHTCLKNVYRHGEMRVYICKYNFNDVAVCLTKCLNACWHAWLTTCSNT